MYDKSQVLEDNVMCEGDRQLKLLRLLSRDQKYTGKDRVKAITFLAKVKGDNNNVLLSEPKGIKGIPFILSKSTIAASEA